MITNVTVQCAPCGVIEISCASVLWFKQNSTSMQQSTLMMYPFTSCPEDIDKTRCIWIIDVRWNSLYSRLCRLLSWLILHELYKCRVKCMHCREAECLWCTATRQHWSGLLCSQEKHQVIKWSYFIQRVDIHMLMTLYLPAHYNGLTCCLSARVLFIRPMTRSCACWRSKSCNIQ